MAKDTFHFHSPDKSTADIVESFRRFYGPTMKAFATARKNGKDEDLHRQLLELANTQNQTKDTGVLIPATFLRVTVSL